ncbi:hypothetical protein CapIbe_012727 [Capra ibex]
MLLPAQRVSKCGLKRPPGSLPANSNGKYRKCLLFKCNLQSRFESLFKRPKMNIFKINPSMKKQARGLERNQFQKNWFSRLQPGVQPSGRKRQGFGNPKAGGGLPSDFGATTEDATCQVVCLSLNSTHPSPANAQTGSCP